MKNQRQEQLDRQWSVSATTIVALLLVLAGYPAFRMATAYLEVFSGLNSTGDWWSLWGVVMTGHWLLSAVVLVAIASERANLKSIGLDVSLFINGRLFFLALLFLAAGVAIFAPTYFYGATIPDQMRSHPLGPVTNAQRFFWIAMAVTAGFVEEVVFRGYALTRLRQFVGLPLALIISITSFALMHGPSSFIPKFAIMYFVTGTIFSVTFLLLKSRRLEFLIIAHVSIDLFLIGLP